MSLTLLLVMGFFLSVWSQSADAFIDKADSLYNHQQYEEAKTTAVEALSKVADESEAQGDLLNLLSLIYVRQGDFQSAAKYARQCNELDLKSGDADNISCSFNTLAGIYMSMRQPEEAEKYILKAISYAQKADNPQRMAVLQGMASEVYLHLGNYEQSLDYATTAYEMEKKLGRRDKMAIRQAERAPALIALGRYAEAEKALNEAIPGLRESGNVHSQGIACNQMGKLMHRANNDSAAVRYYNEALQIFLTQHDLYNESRARQGLYESLRNSNPALAMEHNDRYLELRDSLYDKDTGELLSKYAAEYDNYELKAENQQMHLYIIIGVVCLVVLVCAGFTFGWWMRRRWKARLEVLIKQVEALSPKESVTTTGQETTTDTAEEAPDEDHCFLMKLVEVVNLGLPTGQYGVEQIASEMNMSVQTFRRRLMSVTGESPKAFISAIQMERAAKLLKDDKDMPISRVATLCGYDETNSFGRSFKRFYNVTPSQYREKNT